MKQHGLPLSNCSENFLSLCNSNFIAVSTKFNAQRAPVITLLSSIREVSESNLRRATDWLS
jgi:hypothetical protein